MTLSPGTRIGPYEVTGPLGAGGMGEVHRAHDPQLKRDVAIKAMPDLVGNDPERVARFQREAQVLAALNHPNIAGIHGVVEAGGAKFLVLEFVEGITLADQLARGGPMHLSDAVPIAQQIIDAVEAAHDRGIVHRDLKPANIMLTPDGQAKVLDFGLARVVESDSTSSVSNSPTLTFAATQVGVILGTAAYMSPEQAKGRVADKRSDVWAFGCVLYEMLTATRVFAGEDVSDTLAAVLRADVEWSPLPQDLPDGIRTLIKRCLERDRKRRIPDFSVVRFLLQDALAVPAAAPVAAAAPIQPRGRKWMITAAAFLVGAGLTAAAGWAVLRSRPDLPQPVTRFGVVVPITDAVGPTPTDRQVAMSPDGSQFVYVSGGTNNAQLILRTLNQLDSQRLTGASPARAPFFSSDGKWIGYFQGAAELRKISVSGGPAMTIATAGAPARGASWGPDGTVVFATADPATGLLTVPESGGVPKTITTPNTAAGEGDHVLPFVLPDGRSVLFTILATRGGATSAAVGAIALLDLPSGKYETIIRGGSHAEFVGPPGGGPGYVIYAAGNNLRVVGFDPGSRKVIGDPVPILESVALAGATGTSQFSLSRTGTLTYVPGTVLGVIGGGGPRSLVWINRQGREQPIKAPPRPYFDLRLSPDGTRVALDIRDQDNDIWVWDLARETLTRFTFDPLADLFPIWTRDGRRIVFASLRSGAPNLFWQAADGTGAVERLTSSAYAQYPNAFSLDGTRLLVNEIRPGSNSDVSVLAVGGKNEPTQLIQTPAEERTADVSPDGKWIAYDSNESSKNEIYVRPFPEINNGRWQISTTGGTKPAWAPNGRELFYVDPAGYLMTVPVQTTPSFKAGNPTKLFEAKNIATLQSARFYDVAPDGQRFIMIKELPAPPTTQLPSTAPTFVVVVNWLEELKARVANK